MIFLFSVFFSGATSCSVLAAGVKRSLMRGRMQRHGCGWRHFRTSCGGYCPKISINQIRDSWSGGFVVAVHRLPAAQVIPMSFETPISSRKTSHHAPGTELWCTFYGAVVSSCRQQNFCLNSAAVCGVCWWVWPTCQICQQAFFSTRCKLKVSGLWRFGALNHQLRSSHFWHFENALLSPRCLHVQWLSWAWTPRS